MEVEAEQAEGNQGDENERDFELGVHHQGRAVQLDELAPRTLERLRVDVTDDACHGLPSLPQDVKIDQSPPNPQQTRDEAEEQRYSKGLPIERREVRPGDLMRLSQML